MLKTDIKALHFGALYVINIKITFIRPKTSNPLLLMCFNVHIFQELFVILVSNAAWASQTR